MHWLRISRAALRDPSSGLLSIRGQRLCEGGYLTNFRTVPIEYVDWDREQNGHEAEERGGPFKSMGRSHVFVH